MNSFHLYPIFSDNMVLQRDKPIKIFGKSDIKNTITVNLGSHTSTVRDVTGNWTVILPPMEATPECEIIVSSNLQSDEKIVLKNVAIGEVWIAGGQSNMEFPLKFDAEANESIASSDHPFIRFFDCPKIAYDGHETAEDFSEFGIWRPCEPIHAPYFSAVGYYFAKEIYRSQQVPVGIVGCNWGGTSASAWLEESYLKTDKELNVYLEEYDLALKGLNLEEYEKTVAAERLFRNSSEGKRLSDHLLAGASEEEASKMFSTIGTPPVAQVGPKYFGRPSGLYHTMVSKISSYSARGVIWYQGETDSSKANLYDKLFTAVIRCWRDAWQDKLPFLFVQLAPFESWWFGTNGRNFPIIREKQENVSKLLADVYMASIMDVGMRFDIHPKNKRTVGERLSLLARGKVYGEDIICEAPELEEAKREENNILLTFKNVGNQFILNGNTIHGLQVFVDGKKVDAAESGVAGNRIRIYLKDIADANEVEVQYAWTDYAEVNLYSSAGLSAKPFKVKL